MTQLIHADSLHIGKGSFATEYARGGRVHLTEGKFQSDYVPENAKHVSSRGERKSQYIPPNFNHVKDASFFVRDKSKSAEGYLHVSEPGNSQTLYEPIGSFHADKGPEKSDYIPPGSNHAFQEGPDQSKYFHPLFEHFSDTSVYYIPDAQEHASVDGPMKSRMVPKGWRHASQGDDQSGYLHDDDFHPNNIHITIEGDDYSR